MRASTGCAAVGVLVVAAAPGQPRVKKNAGHVEGVSSVAAMWKKRLVEEDEGEAGPPKRRRVQAPPFSLTTT